MQAERHIAVPFDLVADILILSLRHESDVQDSTMSAVSSDLLERWKQHFQGQWLEQLKVEPVSSLAILFLRDKQWSAAATIFQSRVAGSQVGISQY